MGAYFDEWIARGQLGWLYEPGDTRLHALLTEHGPVSTYRLLSAGTASLPVRAELRHLPHVHLWAAATAAVDTAQRGPIRVVIPGDPDWPAGLRDLGATAPVCMWARGPAHNPSFDRSVTIVGSRASTSYGNHIAGYLAAGLTEHAWTVVSTGGLGIDGAALQAAADGHAVALLGHGIDQIHPTAHRALFERLADRSLLLSAWPPGARPTRERAQANRKLLAAVTAGTVVVEASLRSGAREVLQQAADWGRVGMVVPGPVTSLTSAGCHALLRTDRRIRPVTDAADVVADLHRDDLQGMAR
ncbi:DNA-processing protein DprA [Micromonospora sp. NPDC023737]|uniref:DNA-processing protein DprA n=1 Tax=unclassified Micromonospora TaxID=2617518 RepID=UPI0033CE053E